MTTRLLTDEQRVEIGRRVAMALSRRRNLGRRYCGPTVEHDAPEVAGIIRALRQDGMTYQAIADVLNEQSVRTLRGGSKWRVSSVQRACGYIRPKRAGR